MKKQRTKEALSLSLCMIVKNEEPFLERSLGAMLPWVDEAVVIDTGSTDQTVAKARALGADVYEVAWQGDFSQARNEGLKRATGQWILVLDADEWIDGQDMQALREILAKTRMEGYSLKLINYFDLHATQIMDTASVFRVFRNRPYHRFQFRVHEQIFPVITSHGGMAGDLPYVIHHIGYAAEVVTAKKKVDRNMGLLLDELADRPEDPFLFFNLGREYQRRGNHAEAVAFYKRTLDNPSARNTTYFSGAVWFYFQALLAAGQYVELLNVAASFVHDYPDYPELNIAYADALAASGQFEAAINQYIHALTIEHSEGHVVRSFKPKADAWTALGKLMEQAENPSEALVCYRNAILEHNSHTRALASFVPLAAKLAPEVLTMTIEELLQSVSEPALPMTLWSHLAQQGQYDLARRALDLLQKDTVPMPVYDLFWAKAYFFTGDYEAAMRHVAQIKKQQLEFREATQIGWAIAHIEGKDYALPRGEAYWLEALHMLDQALNKESLTPSLHPVDVEMLPVFNFLLRARQPELVVKAVAALNLHNPEDREANLRVMLTYHGYPYPLAKP